MIYWAVWDIKKEQVASTWYRTPCFYFTKKDALELIHRWNVVARNRIYEVRKVKLEVVR